MKQITRILFLNRLLFLTICILQIPAVAQDIEIGAWRHHLPSSTVVSLAQKPGFIYGATPYGLLIYDKAYNSISKLDKVGGLSDFGINVINYSQEMDLLMLGYQNGKLDILQNGRIFSIPDIWQANILGSKTIHNILFDDSMAYLSSGFGVVVLDLDLFVIRDTWFIGPDGSMLNVYQLALHNNRYYAATEAGLLSAPANAPNLADFRYWQPEENLPGGSYTAVTVHNNRLVAVRTSGEGDSMFLLAGETWTAFFPSDATLPFRVESIRSTHGYLLISALQWVMVYDANMLRTAYFNQYMGQTVRAFDAIPDNDNKLWVADQYLGMVKGTLSGDFQSIVLPGPPTNESFGLTHNGNALWVAPGAILGGWQNTWNDIGVFSFHNGKWDVFNRWRFPAMNEVRDIHQVTPDPQNPHRVWASAWSGGIAEFDINAGLITLYNEENSSLQKRAGVQDIIRVGGSAFDSRQNLWVSNSDADHFLSVRQPNGNWMSYPHNGVVSGNETVGKIVVDNSDQKWVAMPRGGGLIVFREESLENNISFDIRKLTTREGNGSLPSTRVTTLAKDKDGYIWVGTNAGVVVFYSPHMALRGQVFDAQSIIVVQDGFAALLFSNEIINTIFVDGSNKKWFGTVGSGAFLLSPDGRETIKHFNTANSPLPSNNILDISVDPLSGEVFFATDRGLVSYRGFATEGINRHSNVLVFPNPVRPGYEGLIAVRGLVNNARVKITDINGNLVHDAFAEGGQLVWNGFDLWGRRPASGVYLVFSTDPDGNETMVSKIMMLK